MQWCFGLLTYDISMSSPQDLGSVVTVGSGESVSGPPLPASSRLPSAAIALDTDQDIEEIDELLNIENDLEEQK